MLIHVKVTLVKEVTIVLNVVTSLREDLSAPVLQVTLEMV